MGVAETVVLDDSAVADAERVEIDITDWIDYDGVDWGDSAFEQYLADLARGSIPVDSRVPNREITIPLNLLNIGAVTFATIRKQLQAWVARVQQEGGWISRQTSEGTVYADVTGATLKLGGSTLQAVEEIDVDAVLTIQTLPDWYGDERTLDSLSETTNTALVEVLQHSSVDAVIAGNYPGRVRIVATDASGSPQLGLLWGVRARYYDDATTAALLYEAKDLTPLDTASTATVSSSTVVQHANLTTDWTPVLSTEHHTDGHLTHKGTYQAWARVYTTSVLGFDPAIRLRLLWDVGDLTAPIVNASVQIPGASAFYLVNLGQVRLDPAPIGTHRWQGHIQAQGTAVGQNVSIKTLMFQPIDDGAGRLSAPITVHSTVEPSFTFGSYSARDDFTGTTAGNALNTRTAPAGGSWATSGDTTDLTFVDSPQEAITRATTADASTGRDALLGTTTYSNIVVSMMFRLSAVTNTTWWTQLLARYVSSTRFLRLSLAPGAASTDSPTIQLNRVETSTSTVIARILNYPAIEALKWYKLTLAAFANGRAIMAITSEDGITATAQGFHPDLVTGGTHASGKVGIRDFGSTGAGGRFYDEFRAWIPEADAAVFASQSVQITTDGAFREDSAGVAYGPVTSVVGDLPRIPVSGLEARKVELFLKGTRGDFDQVADAGVDDITGQVAYRPCWLFLHDGSS